MGIGAMNASFKYNRNLLRSKKKDRFAHVPGNFGDVKKEKYDHVILKPEVLKDIRDRVQKEHKQLFKRRLVVFVVILVLLISLLVF